MGSLIYDLKHQITDAGGTVLLVHHCNKANDTTGTEALSGHNAIAGAANTILTLHYLSQENRLLKESPQRRLVREARSGPPVDLVVAMEGAGGRFVRIGPYSDVLEEQELQQGRQKALDRLQKATEEQQQVLRHLLERHQRGEEGLPLLELLQAVGALPVTVRRKQELERDEINRYRGLGRLLNDLQGLVVATRKGEEGRCSYLHYSLSDGGADWLARVLDPWPGARRGTRSARPRRGVYLSASKESTPRGKESQRIHPQKSPKPIALQEETKNPTDPGLVGRKALNDAHHAGGMAAIRCPHPPSVPPRMEPGEPPSPRMPPT
jgi:hypothetical protein